MDEQPRYDEDTVTEVVTEEGRCKAKELFFRWFGLEGQP